MPGHKDWLKKAMGDLSSARKLTKDDDETLDNAAYCTQQCAEKALKAYLVYRQQSIPKTHDLEKLLDLCMKHDNTLKSLLESAIDLNPYGVYSRYPDDRFFIDREEVVRAIEKAQKILRLVESRIAEKSNPTLKIFD